MNVHNLKKPVFCFGSNEAGIHGAGAAAYAYKKEGARWGEGYGRYGNSFAIPTKNRQLQTLSLSWIRGYVEGFKAYAAGQSDLEFKVTQIGCGLAGYEPKDIAPMFADAPMNCTFDEKWEEWVHPHHRFWGTM